MFENDVEATVCVCFVEQMDCTAESVSMMSRGERMILDACKRGDACGRNQR